MTEEEHNQIQIDIAKAVWNVEAYKDQLVRELEKLGGTYKPYFKERNTADYPKVSLAKKSVIDQVISIIREEKND